MAQQHDHVGTRTDWILAYDAAGYDVVSLMDYSGNAALPYALRQRLWPADEWVPPSLVPFLTNIELFLPNAEEVGIADDQIKHATSPFLASFIEGAPKANPGAPELPLLPNQYRSLEELFDLVRSLGGFPCLAHPWNYDFLKLRLGESYCLEIFNAQADYNRERGLLPYYTEADRNQTVINAWDEALKRNQLIFGIAVNDHIGPTMEPGAVSKKVRDSGKIIVVAKAATLEAYRAAFTAGSFFAVRDYGEVKNRYPVIRSIVVEDSFVFLETTGAVKWISEGRPVGTSPMLFYRDLPVGGHYVRAEVSGADGSTVYTQAFSVRPVGDVDGDYEVGSVDEALCSAGQPAASGIVRRSACIAAGWVN